jgi:exopolysaccharide biosynthesis polyprenyl glycosylphosphotransferase
MFRRFSADFAILSIFIDAILVDLALFMASQLRMTFNDLPFVQDIYGAVNLPLRLYLFFPIIWVAVLLLFSVYDGRKNLRVWDEFGSLTLGVLLAAIAMAGVLYFSFRETSRFLFLLFVALGYGELLLWRLVYRLAFRWSSLSSMQERRVLILGAGTIGRRLQEQIIQQTQFGLRVEGFLDDDPAKKAAHADVLESLECVRELVNKLKIDDVIVALPLSAHARLNQVVSELHDLPVRVWVIPDYFSLTLHRASVEELAGMPMLDLRAPALSEYQRMVKRAFDLAVVILCALPAGLLSLLAAIAIKLDTPGPVFYRQERAGENGRIFKMAKFRTMVANADQLRHLVEQPDEQGRLVTKKRPDDPRITWVGRFLRRTSLDELPQLWNVLKGDMSLVGPRPEMPHLVDQYELWQRKRFAVPQGMTGWWQINGRSDKPMHLHTEEDLYYVQHYSLWLDLTILARTAWVVLRGKGAY